MRNRIAGGISRLIIHAVRVFAHKPNAEQPNDALADVFAMRVADWSEPQCGCINSRNSALEADLGKSLCEQFHAMTGESERLRHIENQGLFGSRQVRKKKLCCRSVRSGSIDLDQAPTEKAGVSCRALPQVFAWQRNCRKLPTF